MRKIAFRFLAIFALTIALTGASGPTASAACAPLPTGGGTAIFNVSVPANGTYVVWTRLYVPSGGTDAVYLQIGSQCQVTVGNSSSLKAGQFTWVNYQNGNTGSKVTVSLNAGNQAVTLAGLDAGVGVDKLLLLTDQNCVPTGQGDNCSSAAVAAPTLSVPAAQGTPATILNPSTETTNNGTGTITPKDNGTVEVSGIIRLPGAPDGVQRNYFLDGKPVYGSLLDTTLLADGLHTLQREDMSADGTKTVSVQKLLVKNKLSTGEQVASTLRKPFVLAPLILLTLLVLLGAAAVVLWRFRPQLFQQIVERLHIRALLERLRLHRIHAAGPDTGTTATVVFMHRPFHLPRLWVTAGVLGFGVMGGALAMSSFAAGSSAGFLLSQASVSGKATVVDNAAAVGGKMVQFGVTTQTPPPSTPPPTTPPPPIGSSSCALPKYPTPACTGVPAGTALTTVTLNVDNDAYAVTTPGAVIDGKHIPGHLLVWADNVTIKNSQIDGDVYNDQGPTIHPYTITDSTIGRADKCLTSPGLMYARYTATRVKVIGHDDGFRVSTPGYVTIKDSYAQLCWNPPELAPPDGSHSGGIQADCRSDPNWPDSTCYNTIFSHNTIDNSKVVGGQRVGNSSFTAQSCSTANSGCGGINPISGVTVSDNLFMGGGYVMWPWWTMGPNYEVHNNRIVNGSWTYAPVDANGTCAHQNWSGNTIVTLSGYSPSQSYTGNYDITSTVSPLSCTN